ncbi:hypothetical protein ADUPG1_004287, partial [Aduncisulcus paluster]
AQGSQSRWIGGADNSSQDHLERDVGCPGSNGKVLADRPFGDVCGGDLGHLCCLVCDGIAMERGHQETALIMVFVLVEDKQRTVAEEASEEPVCFAGMEDPRVTGVHRFDVG